MNVRPGVSVHRGVRLLRRVGALVMIGISAALALAPAGAYASPAHPGGTIVKRTPSVTVYAPPGKAGASEYFEVVPNSGGGVAPPSNLSSPGSRNLSRLGRGGSTARTLSKLGASGPQAANWARATAPVRKSGTDSSGGPGQRAELSTSGHSALSGVLQLLGGSDAGGLGTVLPVVLIVLLVGAIGFALGRRLRPRRV